MITQVTTCHGDLEAVSLNIHRWLSSGIDQLILVDYACPNQTSKYLLNRKVGKDGKLTIIYVNPKEAGPFYNQAKAKNIGAKAAKGEYILFLDPRAVVSSDFIDEVKRQLEGFESQDTEAGGDIAPVCPSMFICQEAAKFVSGDGYVEAAKCTEAIQSGIPMKCNQIIIRNSTFYNLNGFNEANLLPGLEVIDLLCRASKADIGEIVTSTEYGYTLDSSISFRSNKPASDTVDSSIRGVLLNEGKDPNTEALELYSIMRDMSPRAQPGKRFGLSEYSKNVKMFVAGFERVFNPGLD